MDDVLYLLVLAINMKKKSKATPLKQLKKDADKLWSIKVRAKYNNRCAFCGETFAIAGHHIRSRRYSSTRWDVENGVSACRSHHYMAHNDYENFRMQLVDLIGEQMIKHLYKKSIRLVKVDRPFLEGIIKKLKEETK